MVIARNARIHVNSIRDIVLRKDRFVSSRIPLPSTALYCLQQCLLVCRLEKVTSDFVECCEVASLRINA